MPDAEVVEEEANAEVVEEVAQAQAIHDFCSQQENQDYVSDKFRQLHEYLTETNDLRNPPFYTLSTFPRTLTFALNLIGRVQDEKGVRVA
jgi:hypothetical protein